MPDTPATASPPEHVTPAIRPPADVAGVTNLATTPVPNPDLPPSTTIVPMEFSPRAVAAGFLAAGQSSPDAIAAAVWAYLSAAWQAGVRAPTNDDAPVETAPRPPG